MLQLMCVAKLGRSARDASCCQCNSRDAVSMMMIMLVANFAMSNHGIIDRDRQGCKKCVSYAVEGKSSQAKHGLH